MTTRQPQLLAKFNGNPPVGLSTLHAFQQEAGFHLPQDYVEFLQRTNGGEGLIGQNAYVILWPVEDLLEMNRAYQVNEYAPGLFIFGSDGGGEAFAFDRRSEKMPVVSVPFVGMDPSLIQPLGSGFQLFLEELGRS